MLQMLMQSPFEKVDLSQFGVIGLMIAAGCFCWFSYLKYRRQNGNPAKPVSLCTDCTNELNMMLDAQKTLFVKVDNVQDSCTEIKTEVNNVKERVTRIEDKIYK